jgi:hypothetical protein
MSVLTKVSTLISTYLLETISCTESQKDHNELKLGKGIKMKSVIIKLSENRIITKFKNYSEATKFVNAERRNKEITDRGYD